MGGKEYSDMSMPLLKDTDHGMSSTDPHEAFSDSDSVTLIYTPSTSAASETVNDSAKEQKVPYGDELPQYGDVTPSCETACAKDFKGSDAEIPAEIDVTDKPIRRRRCCGRCPKTRNGRRSDVRRRCFVFLKLALLLGLLSFFLARMCMRSRRAKHAMWERPTVEYDATNREIVVDTGSQAISGLFPLYDLLSLSTTSGSISIAVQPQPADPDHPDKPGRLIIHTSAGSVLVHVVNPYLDDFSGYDEAFSLENMPFVTGDENVKLGKRPCAKQRQRKGHQIDTTMNAVRYRPYEIEIKTQSGSVSGSFIFSSSVSIETQSGGVSASLTPIISSDSPYNASLYTQTQSGHQDIVLTEPVLVPSDGERMLAHSDYASAVHISESGSIYAVYPHSWAGGVDALGHGGSICLDGDGLEVTKDGQGHATAIKYPEDNYKGPEWWGSVGEMAVSLQSLASGSINFHITHRH